MRSSNIGGQAVMEGVMMRSGAEYAVAIRKTDGEIIVKKEPCKSIVSNPFWTKTPFVRGVFNFIDSLAIGISTLMYSASFFDDETEEEAAKRTAEETLKKEKQEKAILTGTLVVSFVMAIAIFMLLPYWLSTLFQKITDSYFLIALIEGVLRLALFIGYVAAISLMSDIRRVYQYHGAEHKCINCIETLRPLTVENVRASSKEHKRCGTSFLLFVVLISILLFMFIRVDSRILRVVLRLVLIPVIASLAYEILKLAGNSNNPVINAISKPGLWVQGLTTREPDDEMIEVGIASVEAVFDWRAWQAEQLAAGEVPGEKDCGQCEQVEQLAAGEVPGTEDHES